MPGGRPQTTGRSHNKKASTYSSTNAKSNNINFNSNNKNKSKNNVDITQFFKKRKANDICEEEQSNELKEVSTPTSYTRWIPLLKNWLLIVKKTHNSVSNDIPRIGYTFEMLFEIKLWVMFVKSKQLENSLFAKVELRLAIFNTVKQLWSIILDFLRHAKNKRKKKSPKLARKLYF